MPSDTDNAFVQATDSLIALYRSIERKTLDLPVVSFAPVLIFFWASLQFYFFLLVGILLIVPTNIVIGIRNLFPGHWNYRPFFLRHLQYAWMWIWRGEAPTAPFILVRPILRLFVKRHFEARLRRLRDEIALHDGLSDGTRSLLLGRVDSALAQWKSPRFSAAFITVVLPGILTIPSWIDGLFGLVQLLGLNIPKNVSEMLTFNMPAGAVVTSVGPILGYLITIPVTAFLAKRGLFLGMEPKRICFPGAQEGLGNYLREREILGSIGLRGRERALDLWITAAAFVLSNLLLLLAWEVWIEWWRSFAPVEEKVVWRQTIVTFFAFAAAFFFSAFRRHRTGRH